MANYSSVSLDPWQNPKLARVAPGADQFMQAQFVPAPVAGDTAAQYQAKVEGAAAADATNAPPPPGGQGGGGPVATDAPQLQPPPPAKPRTGPFSQTELYQVMMAGEKKLKAINDATGAMQPPSGMQIPPMQQTQPTSAIEAWGSAAMAIAVLGSLMTRTPMTTALNSAAAAMKAFRENDIATAQAEFERWKATTDIAMKTQNFQMEAYKAALTKAGMDEKTAVAQINAYAKAFGDNTMSEVAQLHGYTGIQRLLLDRDGLDLRMKSAVPKIIQGMTVAQSYAALTQTDQWKKADATGKAQLVAAIMPGADYLPQSAIDYYADLYNRTGKLPQLGLKSGGLRTMILADAARRATKENLGPDDIVTEQALLKADTAALSKIETVSKMVEGFEGTAKYNARIVLSLMHKGVGPTGEPAIDVWLRAGGKATGDKDVQALDAAITGLKGEMAKIISGSNGAAAATDTATAETESYLNASMNAATIENNIRHVMIPEMHNRVLSNSEQKRSLLTEIQRGGKQYNSPQDVKAAYEAKILTLDQAQQILQDDFGYDAPSQELPPEQSEDPDDPNNPDNQ